MPKPRTRVTAFEFLSLGVAVWLITLAGWQLSAAQPAQAVPAAPTFTRDITPILFEHCAGCHHPRGSAPFSVLEYETVRTRARAIAEATASRMMPPWLPEPGHGEFAGARRLADNQIDTIQRWVADGAPEGSPADLPQPPVADEGWQIGEPDLIVSMPEAFTLDPGQSDVFQNFVIPVPVTETRYIKTIELKPGNPRFIHHALLGVDEMRSSRRRDEQDPGLGFAGMSMGDAHMPDGSLLGWTPGMLPFPGNDEMAWRLPPRSDLVLQLHMLPTDLPQTVQAEIGFYFATTPEVGDPAYVLILDADTQIDLPVGVTDFVVTDTMELPVDVEVLVVYPHAHYLGKRLEGWATLPDGSTRSLIRIDRWDFKWQDVYRYAEPVALPRGTTVGMRWTFDNSVDNPHQRNDPPRHVTSGNRSSDEMAHLQLQMRTRTPTDRAMLQEAHYAHMLEKNSNNAPLLYAIGGALRDQGRFAEAVRRYEAALAIQPQYVSAHINLGAVLMVLGRVDEAIIHLRTAAELDAGAVGAHYNLGIAFASQGQLDEATRAYQEAVRVTPDYAEAHNNLALVLGAQGELDEGVQHLGEAARLRPGSAEIHNNLGQMLGAKGALDEAIQHFEEAIRLEPGSAETYVNLGTGRFMLGEFEKAAEHFRRALELDPNHTRARQGLDAAMAASESADVTGR